MVINQLLTGMILSSNSRGDLSYIWGSVNLSWFSGFANYVHVSPHQKDRWMKPSIILNLFLGWCCSNLSHFVTQKKMEKGLQTWWFRSQELWNFLRLPEISKKHRALRRGWSPFPRPDPPTKMTPAATRWAQSRKKHGYLIQMAENS